MWACCRARLQELGRVMRSIHGKMPKVSGVGIAGAWISGDIRMKACLALWRMFSLAVSVRGGCLQYPSAGCQSIYGSGSWLPQSLPEEH
jgi:hypothetical protein